MAQVISTNSLSLLTQNNLNKSQSALGTAIERLSSGLRINSAKDDAAGQAIANRFTSNIKGLTQASRNANDGISIAQTTEGALNEINNNLQRVRELSVQAANGSNSSSDLKSIQDEITQRLGEINRVSEQTDFNGTKVLSNTSKLTIQVGANDNETITIDLKKIDSSTLGLSSLNISKPITTAMTNGDKANLQTTLVPANDFKDPSSTVTLNGANAKLVQDKSGNYYLTDDNSTATPNYYAATVDNSTGKVSIDGTKPADAGVLKANVTVVDKIGRDATITDTTAITGKTLVSYKDDTGKAAYAVQSVDSNGATSYKDAVITNAGVVTEGTTTLELGTSNPLKKIDDALSMVDEFRSQLGAVQNRFDSAITNLGNTVNNLTSARSRIEDADYATEVSNMSKAQILQQAGTSVLAQANQVPQGVLSLLR